MRRGNGEGGEQYDVIIVGAGSAGCALAARLTENSARRVLIVEAGRHYGRIDQYPGGLRASNRSPHSLPGDPHSWSLQGHLTPQKRYPLPRGKVVGGSGAINGCLFWRGYPADYDEWAAAGNDEWAFDKVLPFFRRLEADLDFGGSEIHGATGPTPVKRAPQTDLAPVSQAFVEASLARGFRWDLDLNAPESGQGIGCLPTNSVQGVRYNAAVGYIAPALGRDNLTLWDETLVTRIQFEGSRAAGVEVSTRGKVRVVRGEQIVLCAGGLKSPHLLMLSGIGPAAMLSRLGIPVVHDSPYVGKNLMDHPGVGVPFQIHDSASTGPGHRMFEVNLTVAGGDITPGENVRLMVFNYNKTALLFGNVRGSSIRERLGTAAFVTRPVATYRGFRGTSLTALRHDYQSRGDLTLHCSMSREESRGEMRLVSSDPEASPEINLNYLSEPADLQRLRTAVRLASEMIESPEFRQVGASRRAGLTADDLRTDGALDRWITKNLQSSSHTSCGTRMGPTTDGTAVVDQYCRVYGVDNLRVADPSVLPLLTRRGPNATAIMLGERVAEFFDRQG